MKKEKLKLSGEMIEITLNSEEVCTRFDRHSIFSQEDVNFHMRTIKLYEDWLLDNDLDLFNETTNMLFGIWDGYLYNDLLSSLSDAPEEIIERVKKTIRKIKNVY